MREIKLDLSTSEINQVGSVIVRQDDDNSQKIIARISEDGNPKYLRNMTVFFNAMIDDTTVARDLAHIDQAQSTVSYVLKAPFFQRTGRITGYFSFEKGTTRESTADFDYTVVKGATRCIKQGSYIFEFEQLKGKIGDIIGSGDLLPLLKEINELNSKIDGVDSMLGIDLSKHVINTANPHEVTASQVGAYTKKESNNLTSTEVDKKIIRRKRVFEGDIFFNGETKIDYNLNENQVLAKVKILFSRFGGDPSAPNEANNWGFYSFEFDGADFGNGSHYRALSDTGGNVGIKRFYVNSESVLGHDFNWDDKESRKWKLRGVWAYYYEK